MSSKYSQTYQIIHLMTISSTHSNLLGLYCCKESPSIGQEWQGRSPHLLASLFKEFSQLSLSCLFEGMPQVLLIKTRYSWNCLRVETNCWIDSPYNSDRQVLSLRFDSLELLITLGSSPFGHASLERNLCRFSFALSIGPIHW